MRSPQRTFGGLLAIVIAAVGVIFVFGRRPMKANHSPVVAEHSAARPSTSPTSQPAPTQRVGYLAIIRASNPFVTTDHLLDIPTAFDDAAHLRLRGPIYLDPAGHLWITRPNAAPVSQLLKHWVDTGPTLLRESPVFAHWVIDASGAATPIVICRADGGAGYKIITANGTHKWTGPADCGWSRAFSFANHIVVPTATGAIVLDVKAGGITEHPMTLPGLGPNANRPATMLDSRGVLVWSPWERGHSGSGGAMRFVDGKWVAVDAGAHLVQMVPLLDGSVLVLQRDVPGHVTAAIEPLDSTDLNRAHLHHLIDELSDDDPEIRESANAELSRYGPELWPVLAQSIADQPPEAQLRMRRLLRGKIAPALGGMTLIDSRLLTVNRQVDGTVIFYAPGGVEFLGLGPTPIRVIPAYLVLYPDGRFGRPLTADMVLDQSPDHFSLLSIGDDWYATGGGGIRRYLGGQWAPMLRPDESAFDQIVGVDAQGRWVFKSSGASGQYLIVDPMIVDPTPRLPVWSIKIDGKTGIDADGWPTISSGKNVWALKTDGWAAVAKNSAVPPLPPSGNDHALLTMPDGTRFFGGTTALVIVAPSGKRATWKLSANAVGPGPVWLMRTGNGKLFLFNAPGRVVRISPTPKGSQPFAVDAVFTRDIPNATIYNRIWIDPAGRIDCTFNGNQLAVMFPSGHMPVELARMQIGGRR